MTNRDDAVARRVKEMREEHDAAARRVKEMREEHEAKQAYYSRASERDARQTKARAEAKARAASDAQWARYLQAMMEKSK
jgi:hypothetical protein